MVLRGISVRAPGVQCRRAAPRWRAVDDPDQLCSGLYAQHNAPMKVIEEPVHHPGGSFRFLALELRAFGGGRHRHAQAELTWVERGQGLRFVGDHVEPFADGDLVLVGPWLPHHWSGRAARGEPAYRARVVQFPPALAEAGLLPELTPLQAVLARAGRGLAIGGRTHGRLTAALAAMDGAGAAARLALLMQVFAALIEADAAELRPLAAQGVPRPRGAGEPLRRIDRVLEWMHRQLHTELPLAEAARRAHVSPAAFSRFFRRETGRTWTEAVNELRCSEAARRLRHDTRPVAEIAVDCGWRTQSHFNRVFRARFGMTPRAWRRAGLG